MPDLFSLQRSSLVLILAGAMLVYAGFAIPRIPDRKSVV